MNILKAIGAILAGMIFIVVTHGGTDLLLESAGIFTRPTVRFDTTWMVVTATVYRGLFMIAGGYLTAIISPEPKMRYVSILAAIGTALAIVGAIVTIPMDLAPAWYPIALIILGFPCVWLGGRIRVGSGRSREN